ncbi:hypothetical protein HAX54_018194 [Datura stramonium]|uniref:Uncharacterized protein n=1 Tax=Datura stramonium TaxID=4076 RepID=A0ABS8UNG4_DATST|nr:hypothetical protein [Datura stramonium]
MIRHLIVSFQVPKTEISPQLPPMTRKLMKLSKKHEICDRLVLHRRISVKCPLIADAYCAEEKYQLVDRGLALSNGRCPPLDCSSPHAPRMRPVGRPVDRHGGSAGDLKLMSI